MITNEQIIEYICDNYINAISFKSRHVHDTDNIEVITCIYETTTYILVTLDTYNKYTSYINNVIKDGTENAGGEFHIIQYLSDLDDIIVFG